MKTIRTNALILAQNLAAAARTACEANALNTDAYYAWVVADTRAHRVAWMNGRAK